MNAEHDAVATATVAIEQASRLVDEALLTAPQYGVYRHAREQLDQMHLVLKAPARWAEPRDFVDIGLMAVRELVDDEPLLAEALMEAANRFQEF